MKTFFKNLNRTFYKNVSILVVGTGLAQLIAFLFQLITRRFFTPADFGAFAVYFSLFSMLMPLSSMQYNRTVVLPKNDKEAINLVGVSFISILFISGLVAFAVMFFTTDISSALGLEYNYRYWLYFLPIGLFLYGLYDVVNYFLIRKSAFKASSTSKIIRRSSEGIVQSSFGALGKNIGLIVGDLVGNVSNFLFIFYKARQKGLDIREMKGPAMKQTALRYIDFPKYNAIPAILNKMSLFFPVILLNVFFSQDVTGQFDLTRMVLALPLALVTTSLSQVLLRNISSSRNNKELIKKDIFQLLTILLLLSVLGITCILLFSDFLFSLFGDEWGSAASYSNILVFGFAVKFMVSPLSAVFAALDKIKIASYWQLGNLTTLVVLFFLKGVDIQTFLIVYVSLEVISYLVYLFLILRTVYAYDNDVKVLKRNS